MGKFKTATLCAFFACFLFVITSHAKSHISVVSQRGNETMLTFQLTEHDIKGTIINGEECSYIAVPEICYVHEKGYPQLPRFSESIIIPDNAEMGLEIVDIQYTEIKVNKIAPSKGVIYRNQNPAAIPYSFGAIYSKDTWYPEASAVLGTPYILRDIRGIVVRFQPFQYNAVKGILKIAQTMTVKVKEIGPGKVNVLTAKNDKVSPSFSVLYKNHFINYPQLLSRYTPVPDGDKMIVICATALKADMAPFVAWKNQMGIKTTLYEYPSQTGGTGTSALKTFIQGKYDSDAITYVLLVGDYADIPAPDAAGGPGDPCYTELKGNDLYPEAFIGRFSGSSTTYIQRFVNRVLKYEKEPNPSGNWYKMGMGIGSADGSPTDKTWIANMRTVMMGYNYTKVDEIYDPGASSSTVTTGLNEGRGWVNYMGHGSKTVWGTSSYTNSSASALKNGDMLPVIISVACNNGEFDGSGDCLGEAFVKSSAGGAIVFLGSSITQAWNPPQIAQKEMVALLCNDSYISVGGLIYNGEAKMLDNGSDQDTYETWILFGDPSLLVFTNTPTTMTVTPPALAVGTQKVTVSFGGNIDGRVCLYESASGILGSAMVSKASSAQIDAVIPNVSKVTLTVTARNKVPYIAELNVGTFITQPDHFENITMQCFPNPFSTAANIVFANPMKNALVTIYSSDGKAVVSRTVSDNHFTWDAKGQPSGLYFVKIRVNGKVFEKRICLTK